MRITLVYLAAGNSCRFGSNKLLYPLNGQPMYQHLLGRLVSVCSRHPEWEIVVVTQYREIAAGVSGLPVRCVLSPDSEKGVSYSIRAGVRAASDAKAYAFFTADQPYFTEASAEGFLLAMERAEAGLGCVCHRGESGNPAWFSAEYRNALLSLEGDRGGKCIIKAHPDDVEYYEISNPRELCDIDSRADT